jgi:hypothetical protein
MLGLESSVMARDRQGSSNVACAAASLRPMPPGERADHRSHRGHPRIGLPGPSSADGQRRRAHDQPRSGPSPARPWRYPAGGVARAAPGCRAAACPPVTSRPAQGEGEIAWSTARPGGQRTPRSTARRQPDVRAGNRGQGRAGRRALGSPAAPRPCPADPTAREYGGHAAPAWPCPPARWIGRSPATRPEVVSPVEPPGDAPARGDHHPARIGVRQGPTVQLLAQARRPPSVHPADLRLALPGVPGPRPAVLQPRRAAVPGARQRAAGRGAGPAVAGQGGGQAPHRARRARR